MVDLTHIIYTSKTMIKQYTSIKIILDKIMRHPLLQDLSLEQVVDYTVDFLRILGVPNMFTDKIAKVEINNHKGLLPCDIYQITQVRVELGGAFLRYASDTFHLAHDKKKQQDGTFTVQGDYIYTSSKDKNIEIAYKAILTDEDGYPMIPENSNFYRALAAYIKKEYFTILFDMGKITQSSLQVAQSDYAWAVGACETEFHRLDLSQAESFFNSFKTLIIRGREFSQGWRKDNMPELLNYN